MGKAKVLIVDDDQGVIRVCTHILESRDYEVVSATRADEALTMVGEHELDLVLTDIRMPRVSGIELLQKLQESNPDIAVIIFTGYPTLETAVESLRAGAVDYLIKPIRPADLLRSIDRVLEERRLRQENQVLRRQLGRTTAGRRLIGRSAAMAAVRESVERVAAMKVDVLIVGETGTGKELVARSVHEAGEAGGERPFVPVDCGAIPAELIESELFGHERGAFTGAAGRNVGLIELAQAGTFFLDELLSLSPAAQAKLLRVLQERKLRRVGGSREIPLDVRVIAAANKDPEAEVRRGRLREDLYYRVNVARIEIPPLRERREDIPELAGHFVESAAREWGLDAPELAPDTLARLKRHAWPGNVRELQNAIKSAVVQSGGGLVEPRHLPDAMLQASAAASSELTVDLPSGLIAGREAVVERFERDYLTRLLESHDGVIAPAAREAEVQRATFYRLLKKYDLDADDFKR